VGFGSGAAVEGLGSVDWRIGGIGRILKEVRCVGLAVGGERKESGTARGTLRLKA